MVRTADLIIPFEGDRVDARGIYLFDCCLTRVVNVIKRSKSRIKLNANTSRWLSFGFLNIPNTGYLDIIAFRIS